MSRAPSRPSLKDRLTQAAGAPVSPIAIVTEEAQARAPRPTRPVARPATKEKAAQKPLAAPARVGKVAIAGHFSPDLARAIKLLAVEKDLTVQALIGEGLDLVLRKHGKHPMNER